VPGPDGHVTAYRSQVATAVGSTNWQTVSLRDPASPPGPATAIASLWARGRTAPTPYAVQFGASAGAPPTYRRSPIARWQRLVVSDPASSPMAYYTPGSYIPGVGWSGGPADLL